ncbi:MAG: hypothetical protein AB7F78_10215 [Hyphomicrobiaceae bacterium]
MTQTMSARGEPLFFPASYAVGDDGAIVPPKPDEVSRIVDEIAPGEILLFTKRLISTAKKRHRVDRYVHVNRARLVLAKACIDRYLDATSVTSPRVL